MLLQLASALNPVCVSGFCLQLTRLVVFRLHVGDSGMITRIISLFSGTVTDTLTTSFICFLDWWCYSSSIRRSPCLHGASWARRKMLQTQFVIYNPPPRHTKHLAPTYRKNLINSVVSFARNPHFLAQPSPKPVTTSLIRRTLNPMGVSDIGDPKIVPGTRNSRILNKK